MNINLETTHFQPLFTIWKSNNMKANMNYLMHDYFYTKSRNQSKYMLSLEY